MILLIHVPESRQLKFRVLIANPNISLLVLLKRIYKKETDQYENGK